MHGHWTGVPTHKTKQADESRLTNPLRERELISAWQSGDRAAGGEIVKAFLPFVVSIAVEYRRWNTPMEDIVQQGCLGLLRAAARFDPGQNVRLVTYAAYWIRAEIRDYVLRAYRMVRLGTTKNERKALRFYRTTLESAPDKLASASGLTVRRAEALLPLLISSDLSFESTAGEGVASVQDRLAATQPSPEDCAIENLDGTRTRRAVLRLIEELPAREQVIARERWLAESPSTLEALGIKLGVTKERVRQIEDRTREKIRARLVELKVA
jgi:RNA polymerase sigma-32 factor